MLRVNDAVHGFWVRRLDIERVLGIPDEEYLSAYRNRIPRRDSSSRRRAKRLRLTGITWVSPITAS